MILSKERAGGIPAEAPDLPDLSDTSALPSSPAEPRLELLGDLATCDGRRYVSGSRPISALADGVLGRHSNQSRKRGDARCQGMSQESGRETGNRRTSF